MKSKIYLSEVVENKDRKFGSATEYFPCIIVDFDGKEHNALFTTSPIERATERADKNVEDMPKSHKSFIDLIFGS